jgi:serine/threonine-protein phosphatase 2A regulatory subunit B'
VDYVNSGTGKFNEAVFEDITQMLVANLFRTLPPSSHENSANVDNFDPEEEEPSMEPAWPHLQIVSWIRVSARACRWPFVSNSAGHGSFYHD